MTAAAALLGVALALPDPWYAPGQAPETPEERSGRVAMIVESAVAASEPTPAGWPGTSPELAAAVLAVTWHESRRWAVEVHDGTVRGDGGRSCGLGQTYGRCSNVGTSRDATQRHLRDVAELLAWSADRCRVRSLSRPGVARVLTLYGTGKTCVPASWSWPRARLWSRMVQ